MSHAARLSSFHGIFYSMAHSRCLTGAFGEATLAGRKVSPASPKTACRMETAWNPTYGIFNIRVMYDYRLCYYHKWRLQPLLQPPRVVHRDLLQCVVL